MAEVTLSEYCAEVKELITSDSYDRAIAICRHILQHFPKHVASYRLLGQACLEKGDYVEAGSLFKRVLSVDLEDVIAYVGLGIIYDEQGALEEATWQLERAFELTPGNAEIRAELQRLYGERDGTAPPRLKLTPAALGRLYLKEELYERAVEEFKGVLEDDPERPDIQVALAEALWWSDRKLEAAEICEHILEEFPRCLKANLILGEILLNSDREEEGRSLLGTAEAVDPENVLAQKLFREQSPVPPERVHVPRLEKRELEEAVKEISPEMPEEEIEPEEAVHPSAAEAELEEAMPDWLRELREGERQPAAEQGETPEEAESMPGWLRELEEGIPQEAEEEIAAEEEGLPTPDEKMPTWLREFGTASEAVDREKMPRAPIEEEKEAPPEAITEQKPPEEAEPTSEEVEEESPVSRASEQELLTPGDEEADIGEETVARLRETMPDESASIEEIMAWMERSEGIIAEEEAPPAALEVAEEEKKAPAAGHEDVPPLSKETPTWLRRLRPEGPEEQIEPPSVEVEPLAEETTAPASEEEIPAWLRELRAEAVEEEAVPTSAETESPVEDVSPPSEEDIPTWLRELRAEAVEEEVEAPVEEIQPSFDEEAPPWLRKLTAEALEQEPRPPLEEEKAPFEEVAMPSREEMPTYLREPGAEAVEEELKTPVEEVEAPPADVEMPLEVETPTWLRELGEEAVEEDLAAPTREVEPTFEEVPGPSEAEMPAWLRELRAEARREVDLPSEKVEPTVEEAPAPYEEEEEAELGPAEEAIPPSFVEEPPLVEIVAVEEEVAEVVPVAAKTAEEVPEKVEVPQTISDYLDHLASNPRDHTVRLALARAYLKDGDVSEAASHYGEIVTSGSLLEEVIDDLEAAADDTPDHLRTHELLADAYVKHGRLQKALDKYRWLRAKLAG